MASLKTEDDTTRPCSLAVRQKIVERLTSKNALSAARLAAETAIRRQNLLRCWGDRAIFHPLIPARCVWVSLITRSSIRVLRTIRTMLIAQFYDCGQFSEFKGPGKLLSSIWPERFPLRQLAHIAT